MDSKELVTRDFMQALQESSLGTSKIVVLKGYRLIVSPAEKEHDEWSLDLKKLGIDCLRIENCTLEFRCELNIIGSRSNPSTNHQTIDTLPELQLEGVSKTNEDESFLALQGVFRSVILNDVTLDSVRFDNSPAGGFYAHELSLINCSILYLCANGHSNGKSRRSGQEEPESPITAQLYWECGVYRSVTWFAGHCYVGPTLDPDSPAPTVDEIIDVNDPCWYRFFKGLCPTTTIRYSGDISRL